SDAGGPSSDGGRMPDQQELHDTLSRDGCSLGCGDRAKRLSTTALDLGPLLSEGRQRLILAFALLLAELLGESLCGLGSVVRPSEVRFNYDGILVLSKNILEPLGGLDESFARPRDHWLREFGGVPGALHFDPDRVQIVGVRVLGQLLDRFSEFRELGRGDARKRDLCGADRRADECRLEPRVNPGISWTGQRGAEPRGRTGTVDIEMQEKTPTR